MYPPWLLLFIQYYHLLDTFITALHFFKHKIKVVIKKKKTNKK